MEDGCSKRFEIGMLEGADYQGLNSTKSESPRLHDGAMPPPMTTNTMAVGRSMPLDGSALTARVDTWRS